MPTRSYIFPREFSHIERILTAEGPPADSDSFHKFRELGIAPLFSGYELAIILGIGPGLLRSILKDPRKHYRYFKLPKKGGGYRDVSSPRTYLKVIQWWILDNILSHLETPDCVFGFKRGTSIVENARHHLGSKHFLNVDIASFFDSVQADEVATLFSRLGYNKSVTATLTELSCLGGVLPQGAPTSPAIGNQILRSLDVKLLEISSEHGIKYSRYADDLTFSSHERIHADWLNVVSDLVKEAGFNLKEEKTRWVGQGGRTEVTGLVVREFVQPPRNWRKRCRATLHQIENGGPLTTKSVRYLQGIVGYTSCFIDAPQMRQLREKAEWLLERGSRSEKQSTH